MTPNTRLKRSLKHPKKQLLTNLKIRQVLIKKDIDLNKQLHEFKNCF